MLFICRHGLLQKAPALHVPAAMEFVKSATPAIALSGGQGEQRRPFTTPRSATAVTFGGMFRIIDITL